MSSNFQENAKAYIEKGFAVLPLKERDKTPHKGYSWKENALCFEHLQNYSSVCNIGVILGERSGGLVDLDFDSPEAGLIGTILFADLPGFGRKSSPHAHKLAMCAGPGKTIQFQLPEDVVERLGFSKNVVLELRGEGGYTMVPGSTHPSGEKVTWNGPPPENIPMKDWKDMLRSAGLCAFLAVVLKVYPTQAGTRDEICLALAGALLRADIPPDEVDRYVEFIANKKGDEEAEKRRKASASKERLDNEEEVSGLPKLCDLLGLSDIQDRLHEWLYREKPVKNELDQRVAELNQQFFVVANEGGLCRVASFEDDIFEGKQVRKVLAIQSFSDFKNRFLNIQVVTGYRDDGTPMFQSLGRAWLEHPKRRQYEKIVFYPGDNVPKDMYNLWQGFAYEPAPGPVMRIVRHIWLVLAQRDLIAFRYIVRWAAWAVQNPEKPAEVALVFRGGKGTGKGTFARAIRNLFGQHGLQIFSSQHISGRFNGHLRDCVLLFADEAIAPQSREAESILKGMLTEPVLPIESKGRDIIQARNHLHVIMASNSDWVVPASGDERRFAVFDVSKEKVGDSAWFKDIHDELDNGGYEAMLYYLQNLDLGSWHPRGDIPNNAAINDQRIRSLNGCEALWFDWLDAGEVEVADVCGGELRISTVEFASLAGVSQTAAGRFLGEMGCQKDRKRRPSGYLLPSLSEAREHWNKSQFQMDWPMSEKWLNITKPPPPPPPPPF
ncbi:MAG: bifunctional DNA primase/polymerase [Alphaproteobacteria bacterium]|nr:bifunctional DNA primase/polymerase [Alphaproteobacteria bacterium]